MNVRELIQELQKVEDKEVEVESEGCDCEGTVSAVEEVSEGVIWPKHILLRR